MNFADAERQHQDWSTWERYHAPILGPARNPRAKTKKEEKIAGGGDNVRHIYRDDSRS